MVRQALTSLFKSTPDGEVGNDDLGQMSSWSVWASIGMYPQAPGRSELVLASPIFSSVNIDRRNGTTITINVILHAPGIFPLVLLTNTVLKPVVRTHVEPEACKLLTTFVPLPTFTCIRVTRRLTTKEECTIVTEVVGNPINDTVTLDRTSLVIRVILHAPSFTPT